MIGSGHFDLEWFDFHFAVHAHRTLELIEPVYCRKWDRELLEEYKKHEEIAKKRLKDMCGFDIDFGLEFKFV